MTSLQSHHQTHRRELEKWAPLMDTPENDFNAVRLISGIEDVYRRNMPSSIYMLESVADSLNRLQTNQIFFEGEYKVRPLLDQARRSLADHCRAIR